MQATDSGRGLQVFESLDIARPRLDQAEIGDGMHRQNVLDVMLESLSPLFVFDRSTINDHPFFERVARSLDEAGPTFALDNGELQRTGVRHVVLRVETLATLLNNTTSLAARALIVGRNAASDLIENTLTAHGLVPASTRTYIDLWNYWDRTGGWGDYQLIADTDELDEFRINIRNNFLAEHPEVAKEFWEGYVRGFLDVSLPLLEQMMRGLSREDQRIVSLPAGRRIAAVEFETSSDTRDVCLLIRLASEPLQDQLVHVDRARRLIELSQLPGSEPWYQSACHFAGLGLAGAREADEARFERAVADLPYSPQEVERVIGFAKHEPTSSQAYHEARRAFEIATTILQAMTVSEPYRAPDHL